MFFLVIGRDSTDADALDRRMAVRQAHLDLADRMRSERHQRYGAAILDDNEKMVGSSMIMEFDSREDLNRWLEIEPYITGNVWETVSVERVNPAPAYLD